MPTSSDPEAPRLCLHGPPRVLHAGQAWPLERKDAGWLAVLALEGPTPRDRLTAWLWPEAAARTAAGSLRQRIFRLRQRLGHRLVEAAEHVALRSEVRLDGEAGELLAGFEYSDCPEFAEWLRRQRGLRHARRVDALAEAAARLEAAGELAAALEQAHALLALEPLSEHVHRRLMRLHHLRGDRAAALQAFERCERLLKDELGARPAPETLALLATVEQAAGLPVPARRALPVALVRPPRLIGRDAELEALDRAWSAGRVVWLSGEAGLGKTRLLEAFAAARAGPVLRVAARPGDAVVPFALLARLLRTWREQGADGLAMPDETDRRQLATVVPEWGEAVSTVPAAPSLIQGAVERLLRAAPLAGVLLDDLHFADPASLDLVQALLAAETPMSQGWGLAQRPGEAPTEATRLRDALAELQRLHELPLAPLDEAALAALVDSLGLPGLEGATLAARLRRHSGGNPLFALETLKDLVLGGGDPAGAALPQPASVGALIERRLRALSPPALALARVAAVAGPDFGIELAQSVLQRGALDLADPWSELQSAQVFRDGGFAHDLVGDAVQRLLPGPVAAEVHASVAAWLVARGAEPARVATHWLAAGRWREGALAAAAAGAAARDAGRLAEALDWSEQGVQAWGRAGDAAAAWNARLDSAELLLHARGPEALREAARALAASAPDAHSGARALTREALALSYQARWPEALALCAQALAQGRDDPDLTPRLELERLHAMSLANLGRAPEAVARLEALRPEVEARAAPRQRYEHRSSLAYALNLAGRPRDTRRALQETLALAEAAGDASEVMMSLTNLAATELGTGHIPAALAHQRSALLLRERIGLPESPSVHIGEMNLGLAALQGGELGEALARLETAPARLEVAGAMWVALASLHLAALWLMLGQPHRAEAALAAAPPADMPPLARRRAVVSARLARLRGRPAPAPLTEALAAFGADPKDGSAIRLELSRALPPEPALALVREAHVAAAAAQFDGLALHARVRELELCLALGDPAAPALAAELAAREPDVLPVDGHVAEPDLVLARAAQARGDAEAARVHLALARAWIDRAAATLPPALRRGWREGNPICAAVLAGPPAG